MRKPDSRFNRIPRNYLEGLLGSGSSITKITPNPPWEPLKPIVGYVPGIIQETESGTWFEHSVAVGGDGKIYDPAHGIIGEDPNIYWPKWGDSTHEPYTPY